MDGRVDDPREGSMDGPRIVLLDESMDGGLVVLLDGELQGTRGIPRAGQLDGFSVVPNIADGAILRRYEVTTEDGVEPVLMAETGVAFVAPR